MKTNYLKTIIIYYFTLLYIRNIPIFIDSNFIYISTILPMFLVLILSLKYFLRNKQKKIIIFLYVHFIIVVFINIIRLDINTILNISQLFFVIYFIFNYRKSYVDSKFINFLFVSSIFLSFFGYYIRLEPYGIFPFQGYENIVSRSWRVSLFWGGDLARTAAFSLLVFILNLNKNRKRSINYIMIFLSIYFIVFSASKTALVALLFVFFIILIKKIVSINFIYTLLPLTLIGIILLTIVIIPNIAIFNQNQYIQQFLNMNPNREFQSARFWLWETHLNIFTNNLLIGKGDFNINELYNDALAGSESKLTYIIARDGMFGILFLLFLFYLIYYAVKQKNYEAYMISSALILTMFFYGSYINGYDFILIIYLSSLRTSYLKYNNY